MTSPVDLCNRALGQIVARASIAGINPPSPPNNKAAETASLYYQSQADATFRAAHWNSARLQNPLTLLKAALGTYENPNGSLPVPPIPWLYEYAYPADCLAMRFVIPAPNLPATAVPLMTGVQTNYNRRVNTGMPFVPAIDLDQDGNQIRVLLTNAPKAQGVYTARINNPDLWDPSLQNAVVGVLAAWFCLPITGDKTLMQLRTAAAVGLIQAARLQDGNEGITSTDNIPDWMQIRDYGGWAGASSADGGGYGGFGFSVGYGSIGMPDGVSY